MSDLAFTTWTDGGTSREDPGFYLPSTLALEQSLKKAGALALGKVLRPASRPWKPDASSGIFTYIDISSVDPRSGEIRPADLPIDEAPSRARQVVASTDFLISSVRPERNAVAAVPPSLDGAVASTGFLVLRPCDSSPQRRARLFLYLKSNVFIRQAVRRCTSSMYPVLNEADVLTILIPRIALDGAEDAAEALASAYAARRKADVDFDRAQALMETALSLLHTPDTDPRLRG